MSEHTVVTVGGGAGAVVSVTAGSGSPAQASSGVDTSVEGYVAAGALAWCAGCRRWAEFVVPTGLSDADQDELSCLQCGWAVLVSVGLRKARDPQGRGRGRQAA